MPPSWRRSGLSPTHVAHDTLVNCRSCRSSGRAAAAAAEDADKASNLQPFVSRTSTHQTEIIFVFEWGLYSLILSLFLLSIGMYPAFLNFAIGVVGRQVFFVE